MDSPFHLQHVNMFNFTHPSLDEQIDYFFQTIVLSQRDLGIRQAMLDELQSQVLTFGKVHPFGSFVTGLSDMGSDVDVYFEDGVEERKGDKKKVLIAVSSAIRRAKGGNRMKFGTVIKCLPHIRVPIVTFVHLSTGIQCDISFENTMAVQNSRLIKFYLSLHPVVRPLVLLIRYWGKFHDLIHDHGIKNYSLALLVLVSLVRKKIVPTVEYLQFLMSPLIIDDYWNTAFCDDMDEVMLYSDVVNPSFDRPSDVLSHALDFFDMIVGLDSDQVVCTFTGEFIDKSLFEPGREYLLPFCQERYRAWTKAGQTVNSRINLKSKFIVQDPFHLRHNTTANMNHITVDRFVQASKETAARIRSNLQNNFVNFFVPIQEEPDKKSVIKTKPISTTATDKRMNIVGESSIGHLQHQISAYLTSKNSAQTSKLILTVDEEFEKCFLSNVKGIDSPQSLLNNMHTLWCNAIRGFLDSVFTKVFDFQVKNRINGNYDRMAVILKEVLPKIELNSLPTNNSSKSKKSKKKKRKDTNNNGSSNLSTISGKNINRTQVDMNKNILYPEQVISATSSADGVTAVSRKSSKLHIDFTNDLEICDVGFCESQQQLAAAEACAEGLNTVTKDPPQQQLSVETNLLTEKTKLTQLASYSNSSEEKLNKFIQKLDCIVVKYGVPQKNPHVAKYKVLSTQTDQRQIHTAIYECHGIYKFWIGREEIAAEVAAERMPRVDNILINPSEIQREISRRVLEKYGNDSTQPRCSFDFACVAKERMDSDLEKPQVEVTFSELQLEPSSNDKLPFPEYINFMEKIFKQSSIDYVHFKLQSWLGVRVNPFAEG